MPNLYKAEVLEEIKRDLEVSNAVWIVDYRGLTVKEIQQLRRSVRDAGAFVKVYKNTLMGLGLKNANLPELEDLLKGPSAFIFANEDVAAAAKVVKDFAKTNKNLEIKGGLMEGQEVSAEQVEAIASLPSRDELMAMIAGAISGVARGLATTINGVPSGLARAINAVAEQKGEGQSAA